jgi:hypothetical protein
MDSIDGVPQRAVLQERQLFTTYSCLKTFLLSEIQRIAPERVELHSNHALQVHLPLPTSARIAQI